MGEDFLSEYPFEKVFEFFNQVHERSFVIIIDDKVHTLIISF